MEEECEDDEKLPCWFEENGTNQDEFVDKAFDVQLDELIAEGILQTDSMTSRDDLRYLFNAGFRTAETIFKEQCIIKGLIAP